MSFILVSAFIVRTLVLFFHGACSTKTLFVFFFWKKEKLKLLIVGARLKKNLFRIPKKSPKKKNRKNKFFFEWRSHFFFCCGRGGGQPSPKKTFFFTEGSCEEKVQILRFWFTFFFSWPLGRVWRHRGRETHDLCDCPPTHFSAGKEPSLFLSMLGLNFNYQIQNPNGQAINLTLYTCLIHKEPLPCRISFEESNFLWIFLALLRNKRGAAKKKFFFQEFRLGVLPGPKLL